ncbi:hypothetical protein PoB_004801800 [Plakobranchus ocellatus]|uniref:Uncharacterized protein n=1 Tax=Plakobranchus ocellatus TaxID=259542 RepID=A0AAV4BQV3_9GAST|nr:hypothetical protein PoB_004801800 [Plakobranchus ocellatus]
MSTSKHRATDLLKFCAPETKRSRRRAASVSDMRTLPVHCSRMHVTPRASSKHSVINSMIKNIILKYSQDVYAEDDTICRNSRRGAKLGENWGELFPAPNGPRGNVSRTIVKTQQLRRLLKPVRFDEDFVWLFVVTIPPLINLSIFTGPSRKTLAVQKARRIKGTLEVQQLPVPAPRCLIISLTFRRRIMIPSEFRMFCTGAHRAMLEGNGSVRQWKSPQESRRYQVQG